eukprot:TRINITY_DN16241_c0_g1_i1.p1 TRINITY_DN16241_c0_g1~~TRINITY_DN16241_c0_g1_i1.p1  ORF type:complete len:130 (-),score=50.09 TRINITY_DN16241_c0_g1_i1:96-485(-)
MFIFFFFFQAEDGIRDAQESRGLGDVYKRQVLDDGHRNGGSGGRHGAPQQRGSGTSIVPIIKAPEEQFKKRSGDSSINSHHRGGRGGGRGGYNKPRSCLLYTSDAADEEDSVDLGGRRIIKKKKKWSSS